MIAGPVKITKQMVEFHKMTFDNSFDSLLILQNQAPQIIRDFMAQASWLPVDGKNAIVEWINSFENGGKAFKHEVDESFERVQAFFDKMESL